MDLAAVLSGANPLSTTKYWDPTLFDRTLPIIESAPTTNNGKHQEMEISEKLVMYGKYNGILTNEQTYLYHRHLDHN